MTESEFWTALEFRVSRALRTLTDNRVRFLWCDGFVPDDQQPSGNSVVGYALISEDDGKSFEHYRFRLWLPRERHREGGIDWEAVIPPEPSADWLDVDRERKFLEIRP